MEPKRVVITGMGVISSVGNDVDTYWKNLLDGVCGIDFVEDFKDMPVTIAGKVKDFDPEKYGMDKAFVRKQDKFTQFAIAASVQAMDAAGLKTEGEDRNIDPFRLGVYVGSGIGGFEIQYRIKGKSAWKTKSISALKTKIVLKKLKKGKRYQVRMRSCLSAEGQKFWGEWSAVKTSKKIK